LGSVHGDEISPKKYFRTIFNVQKLRATGALFALMWRTQNNIFLRFPLVDTCIPTMQIDNENFISKTLNYIREKGSPPKGWLPVTNHSIISHSKTARF